MGGGPICSLTCSVETTNACSVALRRAPTRFERGTEELLLQIREMSRRSDVKLKVYVVQPGLSRAQASHGQLMLLAVTERFLSDTYEIPFSVMCSP